MNISQVLWTPVLTRSDFTDALLNRSLNSPSLLSLSKSMIGDPAFCHAPASQYPEYYSLMGFATKAALTTPSMSLEIRSL